MSVMDLCRLIKQRWYLVVGLGLVAALATAAVCWGVLPDKYTATVNMYIISKTTDSATGEAIATSSTMTLSNSIAADVSSLVEIDSVRDAASTEAGIQSLDDYTIKVEDGDSTRVLVLTVEGKNPEMAAKIANALTNQVKEVAVQNMNLEAVNVLKSAEVPSAPSGPNRVQYTIIALVAGLFLGIIIAVIIDVTRRTFRSGDDVEEALGIPVMCRIPYVKRLK